MHSVFKVLYQNSIGKTLFTADNQFFVTHSMLLRNQQKYHHLFDNRNGFNTIIGNIIINSLLLKEKLDNIILKRVIKEANLEIAKLEIESLLQTMPYFLFRGAKIYLPCFTPSINNLYVNEYPKFDSLVYQSIIKDHKSLLVNPLNIYGPTLFDYRLGHFLKLASSKDGLVLFQYDWNVLYFVSDEGHLSNYIQFAKDQVLKYHFNDLVNLLTNLSNAYLEYRRDDFIKLLIESQLLTKRQLKKLLVHHE